MSEDNFESPFNIKEVNVVSLSEKELDKGDPIDLIGSRIVEGFKQLLRLPHYLDLPAFDAVRSLPPDSASRTPKLYSEQILVLCTFGKEYRANNWELHLKRNLPRYIKSRERYKKLVNQSIGKKRGPNILRTLDIQTPRLVSQMLYEELRLTQMCLVDWTGWRPNVFFELGVRLAVNEIGPVCIIEDKHKDRIEAMPNRQEEAYLPEGFATRDEERYQQLAHSLSQCMDLIALFQPITYKAPSMEESGDEDSEAYENMLSYHESTLSYHERSVKTEQWEENGDALAPDFTYELIVREIDWKVEIASKPVHSELIDSARLLSGSEVERSQVLYPKNADLMQKAKESADERRLAAWFYLNGKYKLEEIIGKIELARDYEYLGNHLSEALIISSEDAHKKLADEIRVQIKKFKELKEKDNGNINHQHS